MSECCHRYTGDLFDLELARRVKFGDHVYLPKPFDVGIGDIWIGVVKEVDERELSIREPSGELFRATLENGYGGWRATWEEAFKAGQRLIETKIVEVEATIQGHERRLRLWERMPRGEGWRER